MTKKNEFLGAREEKERKRETGRQLGH